MKIRPLLFFIFFLIGCFIFFKIDHWLTKGVLNLGDRVKSGYWSFFEGINDIYHRHFNQVQRIQELSWYKQEYETLRLQNLEMQSALRQLMEFYKMPVPDYVSIFPARLDSYVNFGNTKRIWIETQAPHKEGFYGLIVNESVVGIATINTDNRMIGYLNGDPKCSYGVLIGKNRVQGILNALNASVATIEFIPMGSPIYVGDEVVTGGKDGIFFEGIKVGKITKIKEASGYLSAEIDLYAKQADLGYVWLIDRGSK